MPGGGGKINNRKPSLPSTNNSKVNHLLWVSLNFKMFITYKCTLISPPWQHLALSGLTASQKRSCFFEHAAFWAAALNFGECDCFFIGTNNQCWLGFRAELPRIRNVCWSLEIRNLPVMTLGGSFVCTWGLCRLRKQNFHSLTRKRSSVCHSRGSAN